MDKRLSAIAQTDKVGDFFQLLGKTKVYWGSY